MGAEAKPSSVRADMNCRCGSTSYVGESNGLGLFENAHHGTLSQSIYDAIAK